MDNKDRIAIAAALIMCVVAMLILVRSAQTSRGRIDAMEIRLHKLEQLPDNK